MLFKDLPAEIIKLLDFFCFPDAAYDYCRVSWPLSLAAAEGRPFHTLTDVRRVRYLAEQVMAEIKRLGRLPAGLEETGHYSDGQTHLLWLLSSEPWLVADLVAALTWWEGPGWYASYPNRDYLTCVGKDKAYPPDLFGIGYDSPAKWYNEKPA